MCMRATCVVLCKCGLKRCWRTFFYDFLREGFIIYKTIISLQSISHYAQTSEGFGSECGNRSLKKNIGKVALIFAIPEKVYKFALRLVIIMPM